MKTVTLGQSQLTASRLAYGCWRSATKGDAAADYAAAKAAIFAAVDAGYTLFDHADIYCDGAAERVFGRILKENSGLRSKMTLATKGGIRFKNRPTGAPVRYDFSRAHLIAQCERSLEQLGIETIDLLHLHRPDYLMDAAEVAGVFTELRASGKDEAVVLTPPIRMSLEKALAYVGEDELVEVTPKSIRLRKAILDPNERKKVSRQKEAASEA